METKKAPVLMSKAKTILFVIAVWFSSFTVMWQMSEVVIANDLYVAFPDGAGTVTAILSWPALVTAVVGLLAGWLLQKMSTKMELVIAAVLMLFGIVAPMGSNIGWIAVCSFLMAAGAGFANTAGMAIIAEVFLDEKKRSAHMGYYNAIMSVFGMAITFLAGIFAMHGWQAAFYVNWFAIAVLFTAIFFLPNIRPEDRIVEDYGETAETAGGKKGFGAKFWVYFISMFFFFMAYCGFFTYVSVYVAENELGSTAFVGTCSSLTTLGSMIACFIFGMMYAKLHRKLGLIYIILPLIVYIWAWLAPSVAVTVIFSLVFGFCYGGIFTEVYAYAAEIVPMQKNGLAMGLMTLNYSVAITLGVNIFALLMGSMGGITPTFPVGAIMLAVSFVIELISCILVDRKKVQV